MLLQYEVVRRCGQCSRTLYVKTLTEIAMATTRLVRFILSEEFHQATWERIREAVARTRAAGLEPAGISSVTSTPRIAKVTTIEGPPLKVTVIEGAALEQWLKARGTKCNH